MNMKDNNGNNILIGDVVKIVGVTGQWTIIEDQDDFGDVVIKCNESGATLHRHPQSLRLFA